MKVLILGATGLAGTHLYQLLKNKESVQVYATLRHSSKNRNIADYFSKAKTFECDINEFSVVESILNEVRPDIIFHFAAYVSVHKSFNNPFATFQTNIMGTVNILEAAKRVVPRARILIPGSAEEYGKVSQEEMPIREDHPLNPVNPYAMSKKVQEDLALYYIRTNNLNVYLTRTFHYAGPAQPLGFVCSDFAKQVVDIEKGKASSIKVGNLDARRDFTDIRDVVSAYWEVVSKGDAGEVFNISSGSSISISDILKKLIGLSGKNILVEIDKSKLRPSDVPIFIGDNTKLINIGWSKKYTIDETLNDILQWWRTFESEK